MDPYIVLLAVFGAVVLLTSWLPLLLKELPLSLPIICIGIGVALVWVPLFPIAGINPLENRHLTERFTEFVVIVALTDFAAAQYEAGLASAEFAKDTPPSSHHAATLHRTIGCPYGTRPALTRSSHSPVENSMGDDKRYVGEPDRSLVWGSEPYAVYDFAEKMKIAPDQTRELIRIYGNDRDTLEREAKKLRA